jgi:hypothetical protein
VSSIDVAVLYAMAGENDQAFEWLEKCLEERNPQMPYLGASVEFEALRSDPRFKELLRKMNLPIAE